MIKCERCGQLIEESEKREYCGQIVCEDCYIDLLSPTKACDPWAVFSAKSVPDKDKKLTDLQKKILDLLKEKGDLEPERLAKMVNITLKDLEREFAVLRHMELARAKLKSGRKVYSLW